MSDSTEQSRRFPREEFSPELSPSSTEGPEIPEKLQCPLCLEWMQTLGQLNRHLDDVHRVHSPTKESPSPGEGLEVPALPPRRPNPGQVATDEPPSPPLPDFGMWISKFKQKIKSSDDMRQLKQSFSSMMSPGPTPTRAEPATSSSRLLRSLSNGILNNSSDAPEPNSSLISPTDPQCCVCGTALTGILISQPNNCPICRQNFCGEHFPAWSQIRIHPLTGEPDSEQGTWTRTCAGCYFDRRRWADAYSNGGHSVDRTSTFEKYRKKWTERYALERNLLDTRWAALCSLHQRASENASPPVLIKKQEMEIVSWRSDSEATHCPLCFRAFQMFLSRKHHCRLCGQIICGECCLFLNIDGEKCENMGVGCIRTCNRCHTLLFSWRQHRLITQKALESPMMKLYHEFIALKTKILNDVPEFQRQLGKITDMSKKMNTGARTPRGSLVDDAHLHRIHAHVYTLRKSLLHLFSRMDLICQSIQQLPAAHETEKKVHKNIALAHNQFLQTHLFPLKMMPRLAQIHERSQSENSSTNNSEIDVDEQNQQPATNHSTYWMSTFSGISLSGETPSVDTPEKIEYRQVLIEQANQLEKQLEEATRKRKFDDVRLLNSNLEELRRMLSDL